jgi:hypothetical protein
MDNKIYSSYAEIEDALAIIKLEREIHYQKAFLHLKRAVGSLSPGKLAGEVVHSFVKGNTGWTGRILGFIGVMVMRRFFPGK